MSDPLTTCIEKAKHGAEVSGLDLVIASEGSFGPYPPAAFIPCNEEFLVLFDARDGTLFQHKHLSLETVFGGESCSTWGQVSDFAERMKFPEHQLVVRTKERWERGGVLLKGIADRDKLRQVTQVLQIQNGSCWVETDMRAMANPTRMRVIAETSDRFAKELATLCPRCSECWFRITEALPGLPCELCGLPTRSVRAYRRTCRSCRHHADPPTPRCQAGRGSGTLRSVQSVIGHFRSSNWYKGSIPLPYGISNTGLISRRSSDRPTRGGPALGVFSMLVARCWSLPGCGPAR